MTELGNRLKEAREEKKITLDELQSITKIQKRYLQAVEEGNYEIMPGKFYARAFIKQYADAVGLDPEMLFDQYSSELPKAASSDEVPEGLSRSHRSKANLSSKSSAILAVLPKILVAVLIVALAVSIWVFRQQNSADEPIEEQPTDETVESEVGENLTVETPELPAEEDETEANGQENTPPEETTPAETTEEPEQEDVKPAQQLVKVDSTNGTTPVTTYELQNTDKFVVDVTATAEGRSYVGIKNGKGKSFLTEEMKNGRTEQYDFSAEEEIEFNIGFAPSIEIKINGEVLPYPIDANDKVHQRIKIKFKQQPV